MINSYRFFQNKECEYFPCHKAENEEEFNCLVFECEGAENERLQSV